MEDSSYHYNYNDEDEAADAIAENILHEMVSPQLGAVRQHQLWMRTMEEEEDPRDWLDREVDEDDDDAYYDYDNTTTTTTTTTTTISRRRHATPGAAAAAAHHQRSRTPIMSNVKNHPNTDDDDAAASSIGAAETPQVPFNVQSPFLSNHHHRSSRRSSSQTPFSSLSRNSNNNNKTTTRASNPSRASSDHAEYSAYQTILEQYVRQKRHCVEQLQTVQQQQQLLLLQQPTIEPQPQPVAVVDQHLLEKERRNELDFLSNLNRLAWSSKQHAAAAAAAAAADDHHPHVVQQQQQQRQGNFWKLLRNLRRVSLDALLWDDSPAALQQHARLLQTHVRRVATGEPNNNNNNVDRTPKAVVEQFYSAAHTNSSAHAPIALQRRRSIVQWLEQCFDHALPPDATRVRRATPLLRQAQNNNNNKLIQQGFHETDQDAAL